MPPASSPARRVLGEKDTNASLNISSPRKSQKVNFDSRPNVSAQGLSKTLSGAINALSSSPRTGQKRRIFEVEGVEARDWDDGIKASQATDIISDSASESDHMETSMFSTRSAADTTMTSFGIGASQENAMEQQFEMLEPETSQRTLDKMHAVPLPQNASQPSQLRDRPELIQDTSLDSVGMSKFLNFYSDGSSQGSDGLRVIDTSLSQVETRQGQTVENNVTGKEVSEDDKRRSLMEEKASQLRTRLQLALFKVETRQTNTPFSRLRIPESHRRKSESPPSLPPPPQAFSHKSSHSMSAPPNPRTGLSPEAHVAALRAQATMQRKPAVKALSSLPMPDIRPTAFSARWADEESARSQDDGAHSHPRPTLSLTPPQIDGPSEHSTVQIPSSPPISNHLLHIHEDETAAVTASHPQTNSSPDTTDIQVPNSPTLPTPRSPAMVIDAAHQARLSPEARSQRGEEKTAIETTVDNAEETKDNPVSNSQDQAQPRARRLTSSNVKGEAASGLLQLMRSAVVDVGNMRGPMCGL